MNTPASGPARTASTYERSCLHWDERGREGMEAFYRLASIDYRILAEQLAWGELFHHLAGLTDTPLRLLDVACGSGKFPDALLRYGGLGGPNVPPVRYDLLDPSAFSVREAKAKLATPFVPADEHVCTIQAFQPGARYPMVWSTHGLYCVPKQELGSALDRMFDATDPRGLMFIAQASRASHYLRFYDLYLQRFAPVGTSPYSSGEDVHEALVGRDPDAPIVRWAVEYEGRLPLDDQATAEKYLQRCLFDDSLTLDAMSADPEMGAYLDACRDEAAGEWRFRQKTWLIFTGGPGSVEGLESFRGTR